MMYYQYEAKNLPEYNHSTAKNNKGVNQSNIHEFSYKCHRNQFFKMPDCISSTRKGQKVMINKYFIKDHYKIETPGQFGRQGTYFEAGYHKKSQLFTCEDNSSNNPFFHHELPHSSHHIAKMIIS
jgi:hypothetical protein